MANLTDTTYSWVPTSHPNAKSDAILVDFTTADDTETDVTPAIVAIADESMIDAVATVTGRSEDDEHFRLDLRCAYKRTDAAAPVVLDAPSSANPLSTGNPAGWDARFALDGNDLVVKVTGAAAVDTEWTVNISTQVTLLAATAVAPYDPATDPAIPLTFWICANTADCTVNTTPDPDIVTAFNNKDGGTDPTITATEEPIHTPSNASYNNLATFKCVAGGGTKVVRASTGAHGLGAGPYTIVIVGQCDDAGYALGDPNGTTLIAGGGGSGNKWQMSGDAGSWLVSAAGVANNPSVVICKFDGASSAIWVNGVKTAATAGTTTDLSALALMIGNYGSPTSSAGANGDTAEVLFYNGAISDGDATDLSDFFMAKYDL